MIKREMYMRRIRPFIGTELVKVMTGIRRCGKSVMLELIQQELLAAGVRAEQLITYNFEDMRNAGLCNAAALHGAVMQRTEAIQGKVYLFFDEIQEVAQWEKAINSFRVALDCDLYITGSNAHLLSGELATLLSGRYVEFTIYPFSYAEFLSLYRDTAPEGTDAQAFMQYLTLGGMPYLANLRYAAEPARQYLTDIYNAVILNDVVRRNQVRDADLLCRIASYVTGNIGTTLSAASLARYIKTEQRRVAPETVLNYIRYCTEAHLFYRVNRQEVQGKAILSTHEKYYMADHGLREAVYGGNLRDINLVLENIVYMELRRRGYTVTVGKAGEREIDFVCQRKQEQLYVQVCYLLASEDTVAREFGAYASVRDNYPKYVVSMDEINRSCDGIRHLNIRDFLLSEALN